MQHRRLDLRPGTHPILEQAEIRAACLEAIDPKLDFGDDRSLPNLKTQIEQLQDQINLYNTELTALDHIRSDIKAREKKLSELSSQMLLGVAFRYGRDSQEYQMAGGVRKSEQIRRRYLARLKANDIAPETTA